MEIGKSERDRPMARTDGLLVEELDGEVLIYDIERHRAHCLNAAAATVWRACDGTRTEAELTEVMERSFPGSDCDAAAYGLGLLRARDLVAAPPPGSAPRKGVTRREILRKVAIGGLAVGLGIPVVKSIVAPKPAQAFSCVPTAGECTSSAQCCSGVCLGGHCL
jgi:hypothetical protein